MVFPTRSTTAGTGRKSCHETTYGSNYGYVETYRFPWDDDDTSMLMPEEAVDKIVQLYIEHLKNALISLNTLVATVEPLLEDTDLE